ncbi:MAG TPA: hypothetical protein VJ969_04330 [Desulfopila sp.]|nr:hypothetical protein [Desulfopila sp.]
MSLSFTEPEVWRRIQVPHSFNLVRTHVINFATDPDFFDAEGPNLTLAKDYGQP